MSETDDTDELILIPPDFFVTDNLEEPYLSGPYYNVVDSLISQVNHLENRLNSIETKSDYTSTTSNSLNYPVDTTRKTELMSSVRKYRSSDDINKVTRDGCFESTQSTPQKPQTRFKLSLQRKKTFSPTRTSNTNLEKLKESSKDYERKNEATKQILQEIDQYIFDLQNSKENGYHENGDSLSKNSLNLRDLDHMLRKVDQQSKEFGKKDDAARNVTKQNANRTNLEHSMRDVPSTSDVSTCNESFNENTNSVTSSSESTQLTALPNVNRLPAGGDYYCGQLITSVNTSHVSEQNAQCTRRKLFATAPTKNQDCKLLSLSRLWNEGNKPQRCMSREEAITQKLEEEKLRRQHCEQLIQHLQSKTLELQERLAVALQVDQAKDDAILRFHSAWEQVAGRLQALTKERNDLEEEISNMQAQHAENMLETTKKINHFENEASKALSLAQASQEKVKQLESQIANMSGEIHSLNATVELLENHNKVEVDKNKHLLQQIDQKNLELNEKNVSLGMVKSEVANSKKAIELCQRELVAIRTQNAHLEMALKEKNETIQSMERHNQKLLIDIDTHRKIEKDLQQELNRTKEMAEKAKTDLRNFYQDQVEIVVRDKLKEFQSQLDKAESSMQEEIKKREMMVAKSAAKHIQQIADKHSLEIKLLEEKHGEEVRLYNVKLSQANQHIESLQGRLDLQQQKKTDMAKQLHRVMEAQWLEALKIINNGRSPCAPNCPDQDPTISQLNVLKTKSYSNLEEVLCMETSEELYESCVKDCGMVPPLNLGASTSTMHEDNSGCYPYCANMETPLTSRPKTKQQIECELQKYVQLLLNKQPGNPCDEICGMQKNNCPQEIPTWQPVSQDEKGFQKMRDKKSKKPWR